MKVTIIGAGNMDRGIGTRVMTASHQIKIVDHDPADQASSPGTWAARPPRLLPSAVRG
jgi:predicted dinucleotide-binding enzyme